MMDPKIKGYLLRLGPVIIPATATTMVLFLLMAVIVSNNQPTTLIAPTYKPIKTYNNSKAYTPPPLMITAKIEKVIPREAYVEPVEIPKASLSTRERYEPSDMYVGITKPEVGTIPKFAIINLEAPISHEPYLVSEQTPSYPMRAYRAGIEGFAIVSLSISEHGDVHDVSIIEARPAGFFEESAKSAALNLKYKPAVHDGKSVASENIRYRWDFTLDN